MFYRQLTNYVNNNFKNNSVIDSLKVLKIIDEIKTKIFIFFARANSQGVKNKNIVKIKGKPLIFYSIKIALQITNKKNIFISTDSKQIKKIAIENSINIIDRPRKLASGKSPEILS